MSITKIVITGGPCSGKTTGMSYLVEKLRDLGFAVFIVPEIATELILGGFNPKTATRKEIIKFEKLIIKSQLYHEDIISEFAKDASEKSDKVVILFDRGVMDVRAYVDSDEFQAILDNMQKTIVGLRDRRYDAVLHMVTAAEGAADFYTLDNNPARLETNPKDAIEACKKTKNAWVGHPHLRIIDNSTNFEEKIRRVLSEACQVLGVPSPIEKERKFLVSGFKLPANLAVQKIDIEQVYLNPARSGVEERVRRRGQNGNFVYYRTCKLTTAESDTRLETENQISGYEYLHALRHDADARCQKIVKKRYCFLWQNTYYELDVIVSPKKHKGLTLLEIESTDRNNNLLIPKFVKVQREVTGDPDYSNFGLSLK
ncbi:MAG: AAA family ATPase [Candidatus Saccharibacteria bacterium]